MYLAEGMKIRRSRVVWVCFIFAAFVPILIIFKDYISQFPVADAMPISSWTTITIQYSLLFVYPILSGFVVTNLVQREYSERTIINAITAPTSRAAFFSGKLLMLFTWQLAITVLCCILTILGGLLLFPGAMTVEMALTVTANCFSSSILSFLSFLPVTCIAVVQRDAFYPSLICCLICAGISAAASMMPLFWGNLIPWTAVLVFHFTQTIYPLGMTSILLCAVVSVCVSIFSINKQDL